MVFCFSCFKERWWVSLPGSKWLDSPADLLVDFLITLFGAIMAGRCRLTLSKPELKAPRMSALDESVIQFTAFKLCFEFPPAPLHDGVCDEHVRVRAGEGRAIWNMPAFLLA